MAVSFCTFAHIYQPTIPDVAASEEPIHQLSATGQTPVAAAANVLFALRGSSARPQGDNNMLGIIAAVLIILWLLGFFAFHVTAAFIHIVLVIGLVLLVLHFMRARAV
jgi:hypothetical protein